MSPCVEMCSGVLRCLVSCRFRPPRQCPSPSAPSPPVQSAPTASQVALCSPSSVCLATSRRSLPSRCHQLTASSPDQSPNPRPRSRPRRSAQPPSPVPSTARLRSDRLQSPYCAAPQPAVHPPAPLTRPLSRFGPAPLPFVSYIALFFVSLCVT